MTLHERIAAFLSHHDRCGPGFIVDDSTVLEFVEKELAAEANRAAEMEAQAQRERARADAAEQMVAELRDMLQSAHQAVVHEAGIDDDAQHLSDRIDAALARTEAVAGRWCLVAERDAAIAARDEAVRHLDEVDEELGAIKEAITQHLPCYVNENDEDDELDAVDTIEEAGRELARLKATVGSHVSAGTYAKRVDERDAARAALAAAERARDEVGIQLTAAQAEIVRMRPVVEAARLVDQSHRNGWDLAKPSAFLSGRLAALDAVPGDALAPRITAALEASGIDTGNVKGVE